MQERARVKRAGSARAPHADGWRTGAAAAAGVEARRAGSQATRPNGAKAPGTLTPGSGARFGPGAGLGRGLGLLGIAAPARAIRVRSHPPGSGTDMPSPHHPDHPDHAPRTTELAASPPQRPRGSVTSAAAPWPPSTPPTATSSPRRPPPRTRGRRHDHRRCLRAGLAAARPPPGYHARAVIRHEDGILASPLASDGTKSGVWPVAANERHGWRRFA